MKVKGATGQCSVGHSMWKTNLDESLKTPLRVNKNEKLINAFCDSKMGMVLFPPDSDSSQELLMDRESRSQMHARGFRKPVNSLWCFCLTKAISDSSKDFAQWVA